MIKFPMTFEVRALASSGIASQWKGEAHKLSPIACAIPPEFMGPGNGYSPEDFFGLALLNCLIATFKVYAEKSGLTFQEIRGRVQLTLDRLPGETGFVMTQADVFFDITGASDREKTKKILDSAIKDCAISNSIKTGKTFHINIS
ncbi:MAG: OsmC family protein [Verrucomicrobia bacterium]|nr:OsmC family protein [Verrucomicrobiota bacterium]MBU6446898.1 OsmC family protein [Verrucomicrobiota bacterium]MDE3046939.1 OsmC family protein [Verrucomicrobiota bacterium]